MAEPRDSSAWVGQGAGRSQQGGGSSTSGCGKARDSRTRVPLDPRSLPEAECEPTGSPRPPGGAGT